IFDRVNRGGTANVLAASLEAGGGRVGYTPPMDVFEAPGGGAGIETRIATALKPTAHGRSKQGAEEEAANAPEKEVDIVFLNPSAVYGPSPVNVVLNSFFVKLMKKQAPVIPPGGMSIVFVDGVADAHIAAAEKGRRGERYLLSDAFLSNAEMAEAIVR